MHIILHLLFKLLEHVVLGNMLHVIAGLIAKRAPSLAKLL